ncbi:sulfotransferase [Cerasicoccus frondis]|uniref:sulfotransferase n=1 Tax=Cerasicoccus frondis TaxID=490090 RepID=UPI0028527548|nr:sulfotransferase [Cerasicoccus frondis]
MAEQQYGFFSRLLHRVALDQRWIAEASFDLELATAKVDSSQFVDNQHVYIAGFARAGTTMLLNQIAASDQFASLTYADMPFVLMPGIWKRIAGGSKASALRERAHGDGVLVNEHSPEALEEVFWRIFYQQKYLEADHLRPMDITDKAIEQYRAYVGAILTKCERSRYLCKNNNNVLRIPVIRRAFPNARILIPFRDPLQHAWSIYRQHQRFLKIEHEDPFVRKYMDMVGHYEFGSGHRAFRFEDKPNNTFTPDQLDYWLERWLEVYRHLLDLTDEQLTFVSYEWLCESTDHWLMLAEHLACDAGHPAFELREQPVEAPYTDSLLSQCRDLYALMSGKML